ncbi:MAG TPA: DUF3617 family protein [Xanthobacteraceae bacterium]|nr:DUF3617 family protein [Xanthobacteraceae bacterium]
MKMMAFRIFVLATALGGATAACADVIDPGLWRIITRTETGGVIGPPHESSKCLTADQTGDLAKTFSPVPGTVNSVCAPIEQHLDGRDFNWQLVCKGQLNMELTGEFKFDSQHHYTATITTKAVMAGQTMVDSRNTLEGQWVSECK